MTKPKKHIQRPKCRGPGKSWESLTNSKKVKRSILEALVNSIKEITFIKACALLSNHQHLWRIKRRISTRRKSYPQNTVISSNVLWLSGWLNQSSVLREMLYYLVDYECLQDRDYHWRFLSSYHMIIQLPFIVLSRWARSSLYDLFHLKHSVTKVFYLLSLYSLNPSPLCKYFS